MGWYKVSSTATHRGAGTSDETVLYLWADDAGKVFQRYRTLGGVRRNRIPNIREISQKEASKLEQVLIEARRLTIERARKMVIRYHPSGREDIPV